MKKIWNAMWILALICCLMLTLTACKQDGDPASQPEASVEQPSETPADPAPEASAPEAEQEAESQTAPETEQEAEADPVPVDPTIVSLSGPAEAAVGDNAVFTISCENTDGFATATFNVEIAGGCTEEPVVEGLNDFTVLTVDFEQVDGKWVGEMIMMNFKGLTSEENVPVVSIDCGCSGAGTITAELTDSLLSAYVGDSEDWVVTSYGETVVTTEVK